MQPRDFISQEDLQELIDGPGAVGISLFMPTEDGVDSAQVREHGIRLKNLAAEAEEGLVRYYRREPAILAQIDWLRQLVDDEGFWRQQSQGLAVFLSHNQRLVFRLHTAPAEQVFVGGHFYLLPLIPSLSGALRFYVLAISRGTARLFSGDRASLREMTVEGMPTSQAETMWYKETERTNQRRHGARTGGRGEQAGTSHGQGEDTRAPHADTDQYLRQVDQATRQAINGNYGSLVLAGSEPVISNFRRISDYPLIAGPAVEVKPETAEASDLHYKALKIAQGEREDPSESLMHQYYWYQAHQPERITSDPEALAEAAKAGRVEHLLIASETLRPLTAFGETIYAQENFSAADYTGLLNLAATHTLQSSGDCTLINNRNQLGGAVAAAILRY